jgi:twinkle protein
MPTLTHYLNGLRPNELTLFCAPTGSGKTALLATIASQVARQGIPTFVAPVETGDIDFLARVVSSASEMELNCAEAVTEETIKRAHAKGGCDLYDAPLIISNYDNRVNIDELIAVLTVMVSKKVKLALLDNLNFFLEISSAENERLVMDDAVHKLAIFCKNNPIHIILITHPKKTLNGRVESEFDIKGSSTAVQECSNVILFNRPKPEDIENGAYSIRHRELVFKKIRKRGFFVNMPIWFEYRSGGYHECSSAKH